jgi:hypothetical protein
MKRFTLLMLVVGLIASAQAQETTTPPANAGGMSMEQGGMSGGMGMMGNMMGQTEGMKGQKDMKKMMKGCADMMQEMQGGAMGGQTGKEQPPTNQ